MRNIVSNESILAQKFGMLTPLEVYNNDGTRIVICVCECGNKRHVQLSNLRNQKSCGCAQSAHRVAIHPLYSVWSAMMSRCYTPSASGYKRYGKRGIKVCERWHEFWNFVDDVPPKPSPEYSIERMNYDGDYEPSNVKWATKTEQARNRSNNTSITCNGKTMCIVEWAEEFKIKPTVISARIIRGWEPCDAISTPLKRPWKKIYTPNSNSPQPK